MISFIQKFLKLEAAGGMVLIAAAILAVLAANSPLMPHYETFCHRFDGVINDGLMVVFFLLIGMEIKRERLEGELSSMAQSLLPVVAAIGGVAVPALIYVGFNSGDALAMRGWAIPTATDIAFSLAVLSLLGNRVPSSLKIFLMALAVIDDLIAVLIIAFFYTAELSFPALGLALCAVIVLWHMNRNGMDRIMAYLLVGLVLWVAVLLSGVHATIAGVLLGLLIPLEQGKKLIDRLHPWVTYGIMPLFAFANSGIVLEGLSVEQFSAPVALGIGVGLFIGKQCGIFMAAWALIRLGFAKLPQQSSWLQLYAVSMIAGIGFTMSFFIGGLAFSDPKLTVYTKLGVIVGSLLSAVIGYALLSVATKARLRVR